MQKSYNMIYRNSELKSEDDVIVVENLFKAYEIPYKKEINFLENIANFLRRRHNFYLLKVFEDINFKVKKGEALGIIGENGSGKSTLLKILGKIITPDKGKVEVKGKVAAFIELGAGFDLNLNAIENVYLYGSIMGLKKDIINTKIKEIFEFAELERFEYMKLRNFSSGMILRLAFSTAILMNPDILLIDEVLAVGDQAFQKKCIEYIKKFKRKNKTIILVSHDLSNIQMVCDKAIWLHEGKINSYGKSIEVVGNYINYLHEKEKLRLIKEKKIQNILEISEVNGLKSQNIKRIGTHEIEFVKFQMLNEKNEECYIFYPGDYIKIKLFYKAHKKIEKPLFAISIYRDDGLFVHASNTRVYCKIRDIPKGEGYLSYIIEKNPLLVGIYYFTPNITNFTAEYIYDAFDPFFFKFEVIRKFPSKFCEGTDFERHYHMGVFYFPEIYEFKDL